jgi:hypothetical protein
VSSKNVPTSGLSGVYAHMLGGIEIKHATACAHDEAPDTLNKGCIREISIQNICVPFERDEAGVLQAWVASVYFDHKAKKVCAGVELDGFDLDTKLITYGAGARAGRNAETPVILGRYNKVNVRSEFGKLLLVQKRHTVVEMVLADWRTEKHDPEKAGFTLQELATALQVWASSN